jgi:hypothetical protein
MMTVGSRESVSTPQGVGIKPTGHTFASTRRVGLSTFPVATDFLQPQPFREPQCMADVGRRAGGVAQSPAGTHAIDQRSDPHRWIVLVCRILFDQLFRDERGQANQREIRDS